MEFKKCKCRLAAKFEKDNFKDPLIIGTIATPKAHLRVQNNGDEPAYNARVIIDSEVLLKKSDIKGCTSLDSVDSSVSSSYFRFFELN